MAQTLHGTPSRTAGRSMYGWQSAVIAVLTAACSATPARPLTLAEMPDIDTTLALADIRQLASDEFEGRRPGTAGETRTVQYLVDQFRAAGLEPGNPDGTWTQTVTLASVSGQPDGPLVVRKGMQTRSFALGREFVPFSRRMTERVALENSELVFVGYGVQAPEFQWDDFRGLDVRGKTLVVLVNDPPVARGDNPNELDPAVFGGKAMTYYGRWTYKYEKAAALGAAGCIIVHETGPAGYPFAVVQGFAGESMGLVTPDRNMGRASIESWMSLEAATALFTMAGLDYQALKARAATRQFTPVPMGLTASMAMTQTMKTLESKNVVARLAGSDATLRDEHVIYTAHWDHLGRGSAPTGDTIYNGAVDNASGTAALLAIARAIKAIRPAPKRSILFLAVTAEEAGLLGSQYYAAFPLYPLATTVAAINLDANLPMWGRTRDLTVIGLGASDLDTYVREAGTEQGRTITPDAEPEKGFYYRSDHFNFAKAGVPALYVHAGVDYIDKPANFGLGKRDEYTASAYHMPADEVQPDWDLAGFAEQAKLLLAVGYRVAQAATRPQWTAGNEFAGGGKR